MSLNNESAFGHSFSVAFQQEIIFNAIILSICSKPTPYTILLSQKLSSQYKKLPP